MRILLTLAFLIAFSASAHADTITVVNEDGTVSSIDIGPSPLEPKGEPSAPPPVELRVVPEHKSVAPSAPAAADPATAPVAKSVKKPAKKPAPPKQATKKETKKSAAQKKKKTQATSKQKSKKKQAAPAAPVPALDRTSSRPARLGEQMTPDDAIRIALDAAPPARSVNAYPVNHNGIHAYQVVFDTEDGKRSVFVDRETGRIVK